MPQIKSAIKRVKTSEKSHLRNISYKSKIKSSIKKFDLALSEKNKEEIIKYFKDTVSILDKSVNKGILPKNTASRQKANLTKKLNTLVESEAAMKSVPDAPEKAAEAAKKPVTKKTVAPKKKTKTTKEAKTKEKTIVKKTVKAAKKPVIKKTETTKVETKKAKS